MGIGTTSPSQKLHVEGNARIAGAIYDSTNSNGISGQVLTTTGAGTTWQNVIGTNPVLDTWYSNYGSSTTNSAIYFDTNTRTYGTPTLTTDGTTWTNNTGTTLCFNVAASTYFAPDGQPDVIATLKIYHSALGYIDSDSITTTALYTSVGYRSAGVSANIVLQPYESFNIVAFAEFAGSPYTMYYVENNLNITSLFNGEIGPSGFSLISGTLGNGSNTGIITADPNTYSGIFLEYVVDDTSGNMRSGTIKGIWVTGMSTIHWSEVDILNIGNTSALVFNVLNNGSGQIVVDMTNNIGSTVNYTFTPRLITR